MLLAGAIQIAYPEIVLALGALGLLVLGAFLDARRTRVIANLAVAFLVVAAGMAWTGARGIAFNGGYIADSAAAYAKVVIYLLSAVTLVLGERWLTRLNGAKFEYPVLILLAAVGMGMMASAGDLISLYVGVELFSLPTYVLAAFRRDDARASEAGLKYFVLGALSSGLLLYGASLIYGFAGSTRFADIARVVHLSASAGGGVGTIFGLVFLICGLAFKVAAAPFHMWTPDVYEGAPTPVVAFIAAAPKVAALVLFARAVGQAFPGASFQWGQVLTAIAVISVAVGAFAGIAQSNLKRLLAYSSIANVGYALVGLAAGTQTGVESMLVFITLYAIDITGFFAILTALSRDGRPIEKLADFAGLVREKPGLAVALTALSLSTLGLPPFSGFWGKVFVFKAALATPIWPAAVFALVMSVVAAFYYLRLIKTMWFDPAPGGRVDDAPGDAAWIGYAAAAFAFVLVNPFLAVLEPAAKLAAASFGQLAP